MLICYADNGNIVYVHKVDVGPEPTFEEAFPAPPPGWNGFNVPDEEAPTTVGLELVENYKVVVEDGHEKIVEK